MIRKIINACHLDGTLIDKLYTNNLSPDARAEKAMHKAMDKYGLEALDIIYKVFKKNNTDIWFEYGTLLGAYREHGFIPYDYDIDLGMFSDQYTPKLERAIFDAGFHIKRVFFKVNNMDSADRDMTEISLSYKDMQLDLFFYFKEGNNRIGYAYTSALGREKLNKNMWAARQAILPLAEIKDIDFLGIKFGSPVNVRECLERLYGETFMVPIKNVSFCDSKEFLPFEKAYGEMFGA